MENNTLDNYFFESKKKKKIDPSIEEINEHYDSIIYNK
jgi:hypothetical protein